jgi:hypothetical protein
MHDNSLTKKVLEGVRTNPGVSRRALLGLLPGKPNPRSVSTALTILARGGVIENQGRSGLAASWFPVIREVDFRFRKIAIDLLKELKSVHHSQREEFLAQRLQEIFGDSAPPA